MSVNVQKSKKDSGASLKKSAGSATTEVDVTGQVSQPPEQELFPVLTSENPATINFTAGYTKNLGNYESARVSVSMTMPCDPTVECIEETYASMEEWVNKKMETILEDL